MYKFHIQRGVAILNYSEEFCHTSTELLESEAFHRVLKRYLREIRRSNNQEYIYLKSIQDDDLTILSDLERIGRLLLVMSVDEVSESYPQYKNYFKDRALFVRVIEGIYLFWRRLQRYAVVFNERIQKGFQNVQFLDAQNKFEELVLSTYRTIEEKAQGYDYRIYRQITAGVNAGLIVSQMRPYLPYEYRRLDNIPFIESVIIHPPFIAYSKRNKRSGIFPEARENPIEDKKFDEESWFCYPAKVGDLLCFVYFNVAYMSQGISLCNLFELARAQEYRERKPDMIYIFGYEDGKREEFFYQDDKNDMMVACLSAHDDFDYFGYMKKMMLTLHNVRKLNDHQLPIHGAMVKITLHNGEDKNVVIMGDSGAGKSETIEQIKALGEAYIRDIKTIYDDMGVLWRQEDGLIKTSGTEIGAFVRLDDLDAGYGYKELDRSVFMNPDKVNARIIIPITSYQDVVAKHHVDLFLYANNYEEGASLSFFENVEDALAVFKAGKRMAKGTTTEMGVVSSYFANPFGPVQRQHQCEPLLHEYFNAMFEQGIKVGQIRTRLGIKGNEHTGPKEAAIAILKYLTGEQSLRVLDSLEEE